MAAAPSSPPPLPTGGAWAPTSGVAFRFLLAARLCSVFFMHISDCDETYNYWEPFHYIIYGSGFQTWEYSPTYALRSYGYILLHVVPMIPTRIDNKLVVFFLMRVVIAGFCAISEFYFYRAVLHKFGPKVARWMLLFMVCGCGMFVSASAFLPSSFAMCFIMIALGAWFLGNYPLAIFAVAVSAVVGWPFSAALGIPIALDLILGKQTLYFLLWSFISLLVTAVPLVVVDSIYYGKFVCTPLNIILYNVFGKGGPNLYGVEPWHFYFVNGFLNFNVVFLLALAAIPLIEMVILSDAVTVSAGKTDGGGWRQRIRALLVLYSTKDGSTLPSKSYRAAVQSMWIWMLIFFTRPHKEERFLFPIYPQLYLAASITLCLLPGAVQVVWRYLHVPRVLKTKSRSLMEWFPSLTAALYVILSLSRIAALYIGYHAPLNVYTPLSSSQVLTMVQPIYNDLNVCVGKEWHRFPSSFYLPSPKWHLRFIRSEFRGQLPQPYGHHDNATWVVPDHMNDMNLEEPSRYFNIEDCHFLVDMNMGHSSALEPCYSCDAEKWRVIAKYPFLDASRSHRLLRAFYVPYLSHSHTVYADYVLLLNREKFRKIVSKLTPEYDTSFI